MIDHEHGNIVVIQNFRREDREEREKKRNGIILKKRKYLEKVIEVSNQNVEMK